MQIPFEKTLADILRWRVNKDPDSIAHKFGDRETSYKQFDSYANKIAQGLIALDCDPDTRVAFLAKNSDYFFEFLYGTLKSRTVAVGVNWRLAPPEVSFILNDSKSEVLFVGSEFFGLIEQIKSELPHIKKIIAVGDNHNEWENFESWRDSQEDKDPLMKTLPDDDVIQLYTSGTTGHPKGVQLTNANFSNANIMATHGYYRESFQEKAVNLVCMPVFHVAGTNMGLAGYVFGCKSIIIPEVDPTLILELIEKEKIENTLFVPAVILFLIQHPEVEKTDWSSLKTVVYGASPIAQDTLEKAIKIMDCEFWQVYGLTETNGAVTFLSPEDHDPSKGKLRSCGKPGYGAEIKVVDTKGENLPTGKVGEIIQEYRTLIEISDPSELELQMKINVDEFHTLAVGQEAFVELVRDSWEPAKVIALTSRSQSTIPTLRKDEYIAHISLNHPKYELISNQRFPSKVITESRYQTLVIPAAGLREFRDRTYVRILEDEIRREVDVKVGIRTETQIEIISGLEAEQLVISK